MTDASTQPDCDRPCCAPPLSDTEQAALDRSVGCTTPADQLGDDLGHHCEHQDWDPDDQDWSIDDDYCVHCECCCTCLGCEYGPRNEIPEGAIGL